MHLGWGELVRENVPAGRNPVPFQSKFNVHNSFYGLLFFKGFSSLFVGWMVKLTLMAMIWNVKKWIEIVMENVLAKPIV